MGDTDLTAMERGPLMLRLTTEDSATDPMATASVPLILRLTMDLDMDLTVMERGPLMLMLTTEDSDTDPMDMESALLTLRPSLRLLPTTDMASAPLMPRLTTDSDTDPTDMARGRPMLKLTS